MLTSTVTIAAEESVNPLVPALPDLVWGTLAFVIVLAFFWWKVLPLMNQALDARRDAIEGGIQRAEEAQAKATAALEEYTAKLAEARGEAGAIRDQLDARSRDRLSVLRGADDDAPLAGLELDDRAGGHHAQRLNEQLVHQLIGARLGRQRRHGIER